jgi:SAM-dependent methyltransferase
MGYFDSKKNVQQYMKMAKGYDGRELIEVLKRYVPQKASVLELGMGPGKDLDILRETYQVTGSDNSKVFLDMYRGKNKDADLIFLDAVSMNTKRQFDCIYSNKVLQHLKRNDLELSFENQYKVLNDQGILFHTFWYGDRQEEIEGLLFIYYTEKTILEVIGDFFRILELKRYQEMKKDDSFYLVMQKK